MSQMDGARLELRRQALVSIPDETHQELVAREIWIFRTAYEIGIYGFAHRFLEKHPSNVRAYLQPVVEGGKRSRPIAAALRKLGMSACACGWVECEGLDCQEGQRTES